MIINQTIDYYNNNSESFYNNTVNMDLTELYKNFLQKIPDKGTILDLGCGSGRDSLYFLDKGYIVTSIDASKEMVRLSTELTGQETHCLRIEDIKFENEFNGIWACASLLHIDEISTKDVIINLAKALKIDGVLYASYKYGNSTHTNGDRFFNNYDEISFKKIIDEIDELEISSYWITKDLRNDRQDEQWLNVIINKS
tara:strand:- start:13 stop:606 length:594 start_codon:yes stop_codon:yes gene_type:complete